MQGRDQATIIHDIDRIQKLDWYRSYAISANFTFQDNDKIKTLWVTTGASAITINLPTVADNLDRVIEIMKIDSGTGTVTLDGEGSEKIDGSNTQTINYQYHLIILKSDGTEWKIMNPCPKWKQQSTIANATALNAVELTLETYTVSITGLYHISYWCNIYSGVASLHYWRFRLYNNAVMLRENTGGFTIYPGGYGFDFIHGEYEGIFSATDVITSKAIASDNNIAYIYNGDKNTGMIIKLEERYDTL